MAISPLYAALLLVGIIPLVIFGDAPGSAFGTLGAVLGCWLLLGIIDLSLAAPARKVRIERELPGRVRLGEPVESRVLITNLGRGMHAQFRDLWEPSAGAGRMRDRVVIPAGERRALTHTLHPWRRGDRTTAGVVIRSWGPLHLLARQATISAPGRVRVLPPFNSRRHLPSRVMRLRELDGATTLQVRGQGTEFDSLRDYVRGDDVRSIDWRATARKQDLVVRTWRPERDRQVIIVIDTGRAAAARIGDETRLDTAIEASLLLAALASQAGDRVSLIAYDRRVRARVHDASGATLLSKMVESMATVEPELIETAWNDIPRLVREFTTQRALVVLLTTAEHAAASRPLLEMLPGITRKHLVVVASASDPSVAELVTTLGDREQVLRAAAAERATLDARRVERAITQSGAVPISAPPLDLPPLLADKYLELKKAGRL